jgi:UDP:flavonoid glycosyltransferase YjiC (YdhE family)
VRVLAACSLGGAGHLQPLLPFLAAARRRGDETTIVGPPALEEMARATGHRFLPGGEPSEAEVAPIRERLPVVPPDEASVLGNRELFGRLATTAMLPAMDDVCARWTPDLVLREPCEYASAIVAAARGIRVAQVAISLADAEHGSIAAAAPALEARRTGLVDRLLGMPYLTRFPTSIDPSRFPDTRRFSVAEPGEPAPLPDWWDGSSAPLVYLTFGTVLGHMSFAAGVYRTAIDAVADLDARVLLTVGRRIDPADLGPIPAHVRVEPWVEQRDVLAHAELVVCHGGSGTTFGALAAGVPLVVVPVFADQFENGRRVARSGAGLAVEVEPATGDGSRRVISADDAPRIALTVAGALTDPSLRDHARRIGREMAGAPAVDQVLDELLAS